MIKMIEKIEMTMINETVHNFRKGEFGVQNIEIDESRGFIEIEYGVQEGGEKKVMIPLQNVEKCEFIVKNVDESKVNHKKSHPNKTNRPNLKKNYKTERSNPKKEQKTNRPNPKKNQETERSNPKKEQKTNRPNLKKNQKTKLS